MEEEKPPQLPSEEIRRRLIEKAELLKDLEARNPKPAPATEATPSGERLAPLHPIKEPIRVDARKLSVLAAQAQKAEKIAMLATKKAEALRQDAIVTRNTLNDYMRETGLLP